MPAIDAWLVPSAIVCPRSGVCLLWCSAIWSPKPPAVHLTVPLPSVLVTRQDITINQHINMLICWLPKCGSKLDDTLMRLMSTKHVWGGLRQAILEINPTHSVIKARKSATLGGLHRYFCLKTYFSFIEGKAFGSPGQKCFDICQYCCKQVEIYNDILILL